MEIIYNHLIEIIITLISSFAFYLYRKIKKTILIINGTKNSMIEIIKNIIIDKYYILKRTNCITLEEKEYINDLYNEYKKLGGNDIINHIMLDINNFVISKSCN